MRVYGSGSAFAAVLADDSLVAWGALDGGGKLPAAASSWRVAEIYAATTSGAFAALLKARVS